MRTQVNTVYNILYATEPNKSLKYDRDMELKARDKFEKFLSKDVRSCGLVIDSDFPFLVGSPGTNLFSTF